MSAFFGCPQFSRNPVIGSCYYKGVHLGVVRLHLYHGILASVPCSSWRAGPCCAVKRQTPPHPSSTCPRSGSGPPPFFFAARLHLPGPHILCFSTHPSPPRRTASASVFGLTAGKKLSGSRRGVFFSGSFVRRYPRFVSWMDASRTLSLRLQDPPPPFSHDTTLSNSPSTVCCTEHRMITVLHPPTLYCLVND